MSSRNHYISNPKIHIFNNRSEFPLFTGINNNEVIMMKMQLYLLFGFIFALLIATFAVINVGDVEINYLFGTAKWPLVLVILGSAVIGGLSVGLFGLIKVIQLQRQVKKLHQIHNEKETWIMEKRRETAEEKAAHPEGTPYENAEDNK
jgi:lipopolysaccharide assembly protein A